MDRDRKEATTGAERVRKLRRQREAAGLVRVEVYVPKESVTEIRRIARELAEPVLQAHAAVEAEGRD